MYYFHPGIDGYRIAIYVKFSFLLVAISHYELWTLVTRNYEHLKFGLRDWEIELQILFTIYLYLHLNSRMWLGDALSDSTVPDSWADFIYGLHLCRGLLLTMPRVQSASGWHIPKPISSSYRHGPCRRLQNSIKAEMRLRSPDIPQSQNTQQNLISDFLMTSDKLGRWW